MQWIKHKKEERMPVAAKVIGAVRLGLVDIRVVIEELNTEEMKRVPEIFMHLHEASLYNNMPSHNSKFALEKSKPRATSPALIGVEPQAQMQYFDVQAKTWKPLASTIPEIQATHCYCAISVGSKLFVAGLGSSGFCIFQYSTEGNVWERLLHQCGVINNLWVIDDHMYAISVDSNQALQRYSFARRQWQSIPQVGTRGKNYCPGKNIAIIHSKVFVLYENSLQLSYWLWSLAVLNCFDPVKNEWELKAATCQPHFGSSLIVVDNRLYVAGGYVSPLTDDRGRFIPCGNPAPVEMYNEENNTWSVVEQKHIPPNNLGAVEIEGRVYFTINNFPIDSGIRIPPGEMYPVHLGEWENLGKIDKSAVLCYLPVKRESLKTE
ncbi:kelch-like protein 5 [Orbicella faveolata]|uniref:kelch-like protein 5 n=1 Tax=Orbicella faveolata TaxID=48498 RepID=UPI0009E3E277|nr:kelch-like protein 5 [Orbicella faveolata]